jgi:hypothetical protein
MKTFLCIILLALITFSCQKEISLENIVATLPTLTTTTATSITNTTAASGGNITNDGGAAITFRGVCWSTTANPTIALSTKTTDGTGSGTFASNITSLTSTTVYYVRAYATNSAGTAYGNEISFTTTNTTTALPTVTTTSLSSVTMTTASGGGNVVADGGATVTARGVCWSTSANPTNALSTKTINGTGTGIFTSAITGLTAATTYHVRAYATNSVGTAYGGDSTFTTTAIANIPTLTTTPITDTGATTATSGGNITSDGGAAVTARGVCWNTSANPVATGNHTTNGTGTGTFTSVITGLTKNTTYHVRAYATNSFGTAYGNEIIFTTLDHDTYIGGCSPANDEPAIWKNGVPTILSSNRGIVYCIYVVNDDVYAGGIELAGGNWVAKTWKNGVVTTLSDGTDNANVQSIYVAGSDVYAVGNDKNKAMIWKNGTGTILPNGNYAKGVFVSGPDVYTCGDDQVAWNAPSYAVSWKNNVFTDLTNRSLLSNANAIAVSGPDVYIGGRENLIAKIWKNGVSTSLSDGTKFNMLTALYINGADVYAGGIESFTPGGNTIAKIWKNGIATNLTDGSLSATVNSIFMFGTDLYVCGMEYETVTIWKNGVPSASSVIVSHNYPNYAVYLR